MLVNIIHILGHVFYSTYVSACQIVDPNSIEHMVP